MHAVSELSDYSAFWRRDQRVRPSRKCRYHATQGYTSGIARHRYHYLRILSLARVPPYFYRCNGASPACGVRVTTMGILIRDNDVIKVWVATRRDGLLRLLYIERVPYSMYALVYLHAKRTLFRESYSLAPREICTRDRRSLTRTHC